MQEESAAPGISQLPEGDGGREEQEDGEEKEEEEEEDNDDDEDAGSPWAELPQAGGASASATSSPARQLRGECGEGISSPFRSSAGGGSSGVASPGYSSPSSVQQLMHQRLFGAGAGSGESSIGSPGSPPTGQQRRKPDPTVMSRLLAKKERKDGPLSPEHTFRPHISEASRKTGKAGDEPRWMVLAKDSPAVKAEKRELKKNQMMLTELQGCTFSPSISQASSKLVQKSEGRLKRWNTPQAAEEERGGQSEEESPRSPRSPQAGQSTMSSSLGSAMGSTMASTSRLAALGKSRTRPNLNKSASTLSQVSTRSAGKEVDLSDPLFDELHKLLMSLPL